MRPIDNTQKWLEIINSKSALEMLTEKELECWNNISPENKSRYIKALIEKPIVFENPEIIYDWYFRNKWATALKTVCHQESISVFEIGAGGCDIVPKAVSMKFCHPKTRYFTANLNKELTQIFKWKTEVDPVDIYVIEDDAANIKTYVGENAFDAIVFEHSVNDVLETIIAEKYGIDTVNRGWMEILPAITEAVNKEWNNKTFEQNTKNEFLNLIHECRDVLKHDGWLIFAHYQFQYNLDIGLSPELNQNIIPIVRKWISDSNIGKEYFFDGFDSNWWMFVRI